jgi:hypothetical protein
MERFFCFGCMEGVISALGAHLPFIGEAKASRWLAHTSKPALLHWKATFPCKLPKYPQSQDLFMTFWLFVLSFQQLLQLPSVNTLGFQISQEPALPREFSSFKLNPIVEDFKARFLGQKLTASELNSDFTKPK